jgi:hypothetical protein
MQGLAAATALPAHHGAAVLDCESDERALRERLAQLEVEQGRLEEELDRRYVAAQAGPSASPPDALPPGPMGSLARVAFGRDLLLLHCREYPCIAVVAEAPTEKALSTLREGGLAPRVVREGTQRAVVLADADWPPPERTTPRVAALLRLVGP